MLKCWANYLERRQHKMLQKIIEMPIDPELAKRLPSERLDYYRKLLEEDKDDLGLLINWANKFGDIQRLTEMARLGIYDPLYVTPAERWNYLHKCNIGLSDDIATIKFYLKRGVSVNAQDVWGRTPLHYAMSAPNPEAALLFLEAGADPNIPDFKNQVPIGMMGYMPERLDVLESLLKNGGNVHYHAVNVGMSIIDAIKTYRADDERFRPILEMMEKYA